MVSTENLRAESATASWDSPRAEAMAAASEAASLREATNPAPGAMISAMAPAGRAATGVPQASASTTFSPNGSSHSGEATNTSEPDTSWRSSAWSRCPA